MQRGGNGPIVALETALRGNTNDLLQHLHPVPNGCLNPRMKITSNQRNLALMVKEAIESDPEIDNLPDFWYVQLAIVNGDNLEASISQAGHMQYLREEYGIRDTLADAKKILWDYLNSEEKWMLSFCYVPQLDGMIAVIDLTAKDVKDLAKPDGWKILAGEYYLRQALNPDLVCVSTGVTTIFECQGFDWKKSGGMSNILRFCKEVVGPYPQNVRSTLFFHTGEQFNGSFKQPFFSFLTVGCSIPPLVGVLANLAHSIVKPFMPEQMKQKCKFGCQFPQGIAKCMLGPDPKGKLELNYARIMTALECRYENERNFKL